MSELGYPDSSTRIGRFTLRQLSIVQWIGVVVAPLAFVALLAWIELGLPRPIRIAVPVAVVGTFAVMAALGFSLNNISLFGLVLAIGIVVDDAIVVVENVERWLEHGEAPREAARKAMDEVTGPVIAIALVLSAGGLPSGSGNSGGASYCMPRVAGTSAPRAP